MSANESNRTDASQDALAYYGKSVILVPLIIGGALVVAVILFWHAQNRRARLAEAAQVEEMVRRELRVAYIEMRALRPAMALERSDAAKELIARLLVNLAPDYAELKMSQLLVEAESLFMLDCGAYAKMAEERFDKALSLMTHASGEMWQFGMLGRARTRFEEKLYSEALADLDAIMDRNSSFGAAYYWRSLTRRELGDTKGAAEDETRARALDSWPPLRDFMQASCIWTRDILSKPEPFPEERSEGGLVDLFAHDPEADAAAALQE